MSEYASSRSSRARCGAPTTRPRCTRTWACVDRAGAARGPRRARGRPGRQAARARRRGESAATCTRTRTGATARRRSSRWSPRPGRGYEYLNVTDHSPAVGFGMGLDAGRLHAQIERVRALAATLEPGIHTARRRRGGHPPRRLAGLLRRAAGPARRRRGERACSHRLSAADQTKRVCAALENPQVAHPRPPHRAADRPAPAEPARHRGGGGEGGRDGDGARGELPAHRLDLSDVAHPPGRRGGRPDRDRHRRALGGGARLPALRRDECPPGLDRARGRRQHAVVAGAAQAAQVAGPGVRYPGSTTSPSSTSVSRSRAVTMTTSAQKNWRRGRRRRRPRPARSPRAPVARLPP